MLVEVNNMLYSSISELVWGYLMKAYCEEKFGHDKADDYFNMVNDFTYLGMTLMLIADEEKTYQEQSLNATECVATHNYSYYDEKYGLSCIIKYQKCKKINIEKIVKDIISTYIITADGIGGMYIETTPGDNCTNYNLFRIS
mgnify:CR=1 FL=1